MNRKTISLAVAALLGGALISGCTHRKGAHRPSATPQLAKVETWNATPAGGAAAKPADDVTLSHWWSMLGDPILTSLEDRAVKANLDVRRAETKIRQAQSSRESARADLLPTYSVSGSQRATAPAHSRWARWTTRSTTGNDVEWKVLL